MRFSAVLFDMDGVLIDSESIYWKTEWDFYKTLGVELTKPQMTDFMGASPRKNACKVLEWNPWLKEKYTPDQMGDMHEGMLLDAAKKVETLIPGVEQWLRDIRAVGLGIAVASSSPAIVVNHIAEKFDFAGLFDTIVSVRDVKNAKPAPDIFLEAARRLSAPAEKCLVIEDSQNGILAAHAAGMAVAAFSGALMGPAPKGADWTFPRYDALHFELITGLEPQ